MTLLCVVHSKQDLSNVCDENDEQKYSKYIEMKNKYKNEMIYSGFSDEDSEDVSSDMAWRVF